MPLTNSEKKALLVNVFRLSLAVAEKRSYDAVEAYSNIVDGAFTDDDDYDDLPPLVPLTETKGSSPDIDLVISEMPSEIMKDDSFVTKRFGVGASNYLGQQRFAADFDSGLNDCVASVSDQEDEESDADEEVDEEEATANAEEEEEEEAEETADAEDDEEELEATATATATATADATADAEEVEAVELEVDIVRIKKVLYWKDVNSGDIYSCLPDDEVGEKVGRYIDGKPVFD